MSVIGILQQPYVYPLTQVHSPNSVDRGCWHEEAFGLIGATLVAIVAFIVDSQSFAQDLPSCGDRSVTYSPFDEHFAANVAARAGPINALNVGEKQFSPQKTIWMTVNRPDYTKPGPWNTQVFIRTAKGGTPELLTFIDHGSGGVELQWLNEKLLYGSVWWGRIVSTDFIFDVEKKNFIYKEMANYGELVQPCQ